MLLTVPIVQAGTGASLARAQKWLGPLQVSIDEFEITNEQRVAAYLAQVGHESGGLQWVAELADGSAYDIGKLAIRLGNTPEADGDGQKFKGRGLIQLTGLRNYILALMALDIDAINHPEILQTPEVAARVAGWYWWNNRLNRFADKDDFLGLTKAINGGTNGLEDRKRLWKAGRKAMGLSVIT